MTLLRWLLRLVLALVVLIVLLFGGARFHDGPIGPIPGGPLAAGALVGESVTDWSFAKDAGEIELQLESQRQSRTVWILVFDGKAYVPCNLAFPPGKSWYTEAAKDGRATLRIDGKRYPVTLTKLDDAVTQKMEPLLRAEVNRKYGSPPPVEGAVWLFEVSSQR